MRDDHFERLYREHADALFSFLAYRVGDRTIAEDLFADTFERVLTSRRGPRARESERAWLYTIALNILRDHARRRAAEARALERRRPALDVDPLESVETRNLVLPLLQRLSEHECEVIALRFGAGLTVPEIADVLNEPLTTVEGRVYRALRKLRAEMEC